jgi:gluconolactonase
MRASLAILFACVLSTFGVVIARSADDAPLATIDLATREGVALVKGAWRYSDTRVVDVEFIGPGPDGQPTGSPVMTYDIVPKAGGTDYDDSGWTVVDPTNLSTRRGNGRVGFSWYRINITIPDRIGGFDPRGADVIFETSVDDYAEVWVDGELPRAAGQGGGSVIGGWNVSNRLPIGRRVQPGQRIQLAVFSINGPISSAPTNFIWMRHARLTFVKGTPPSAAVVPQEVDVVVEHKDPAMARIVGANPKLYKLAEGLTFTEGPVWDAREQALLFSDPNENTIYRYSKSGELRVFRTPSGYSGADIGEYKQPGSNGLAFDRSGRLTINEHGNRRISRTESNGQSTVLVDRYEGKRFNSPNDLVYRSDGALFFTDPPFGLPKVFDDNRKELPFSGVYVFQAGAVRLLTKELSGPNGLAFSPDERRLYVGNWDDQRKVVMRYDVDGDGALSNAIVFADLTSAPGDDAIDGVKVDVEGNVYISGPGGLWVIAPDGRHLGTIRTARHVHNMAWGDADGQTLYLTARDRLYRMRMGIAGAR